jgi:hypothetical protein
MSNANLTASVNWSNRIRKAVQESVTWTDIGDQLTLVRGVVLTPLRLPGTQVTPVVASVCGLRPAFDPGFVRDRKPGDFRLRWGGSRQRFLGEIVATVHPRA